MRAQYGQNSQYTLFCLQSAKIKESNNNKTKQNVKKQHNECKGIQCDRLKSIISPISNNL